MVSSPLLCSSTWKADTAHNMALEDIKTQPTSTQEIKKGAGMDNVTDELKEKARPKHNEMITELKTMNDKQEVNIILLDRLCELKEMQQASDNTFRDDWAKLKHRDSKITHVLLVIAITALMLDFIQLENGTMLEYVLTSASTITGLL